MKKGRGIFILATLVVSMLFSTAALGISFAIYTNTTSQSEGSSGIISLRSYYDSGIGTEDDPFVITRPRHLYNLSRLQGLGVYDDPDPERQVFFQLGKQVYDSNGDVLFNGKYMCYPDDSDTRVNNMVPYLDMSDSDYNNNPIYSIGSEALPFYGVFDGKNVEIKDLNVYANPQDVGLFGYTAHGSSVHNLFLTNITINALGYTSLHNDLYSPDSHISENVAFDYDGHNHDHWYCSVCKKSYAVADLYIDTEHGNAKCCPVHHAQQVTNSDHTFLGIDSIDTLSTNFYCRPIWYCSTCNKLYLTSELYEEQYCPVHHSTQVLEKDYYCPECDEFYLRSQLSGVHCPIHHDIIAEQKQFAFDVDELTGLSDIIPSITIDYPENGQYSNYSYFPILSGDLIKFEDQTKTIVPNLEKVFEFFYKKMSEDIEYPLKASSTASLVAMATDNDGLKHSKVALTLKIDFTLESKGNEHISMDVYVGSDHGNNIGIIIGHCDGSVTDCYVCGATLNMNNGDDVTKSRSGTYKKLEYGSNLGLIGLIGNTVYNKVSTDALGDGTSTGVLDFSTVYDQIINKNTSFSGVSSYAAGVNAGYPNATTYKPITSSKYLQYLRQLSAGGDYVTLETNAVSFKGNEIISNDDLGVFTIATIYRNEATGGDSNFEMDTGVIKHESDLSVGDLDGDSAKDYYIYYTTGEYSASSGISYSKYRAAMSPEDTGEKNIMFTGFHLPEKTQISQSSMSLREQKQNYIFRFKIDANYRKQSGKFYFADVDTECDGGAFLSNYFFYKLVDENGDPFTTKRNEVGVLLRDYLKQEITSFSSSYALQDLSNKNAPSSIVNSIERWYCSECKKSYFKTELYNNSYCPVHHDHTVEFMKSEKWYYCSTCKDYYLEDELYEAAYCPKHTSTAVTHLKDKFVCNTINFDIKTPYANVTVVAAPDEQGKPAALGVYKINHSEFVGDEWSRKYDSPDYAFFMPNDDHLAYFDYVVDKNPNSDNYKKGEIGVYDSSGNFSIAETKSAGGKTLATIANEGGSNNGEYASGYSAQTGKKPRLFAHTFKLPRGRYCLGSASGATGTGSGETDVQDNTQTNAKIYYVCAQGQTEGQMGFKDNVFGNDSVDKVDFVKIPLFNESTKEQQISLVGTDTYSGSTNKLEDQRLYLCLANSSRSQFADIGKSNLTFTYNTNDNKFYITSNNVAAMIHVAVSNYNHSLNGPDKVLYVSLLGANAKADELIVN